MQQRTITLDAATDWPGFRREARTLLAGLVPPESVHWATRDAGRAIADPRPGGPAQHGAPNLVVPQSFMTLCETVVLHGDPQRFGLLYRLLWRLVHEPELKKNRLDVDRVRALHMAQAVRRDMQRMKTQLHFRAIDDGAGPLHAAWFEPTHHIVEALAPFFARRLACCRWAILTPECSVRSDGGTAFEFGPGARHDRSDAPDVGDDRWLWYYQCAFGVRRTCDEY